MFTLHRFPAAPDLRRRWLANLNWKDFLPSKSSRVCSDHFLDGRRTAENPVPFVRLVYDRKAPSRTWLVAPDENIDHYKKMGQQNRGTSLEDFRDPLTPLGREREEDRTAARFRRSTVIDKAGDLGGRYEQGTPAEDLGLRCERRPGDNRILAVCLLPWSMLNSSYQLPVIEIRQSGTTDPCVSAVVQSSQSESVSRPADHPSHASAA
ncbi:hypothetical protein HPB47_005565 [Ixodes persulcatus]|uniref:Uncharacterized protein n=1 Tax=Ixodes persulcatus TaxID=34615 RepID=A0AC60PCP2_IXOPE|nr:hypothetical protein HPB47_005565 [Ixodes persulcatus]